VATIVDRALPFVRPKSCDRATERRGVVNAAAQASVGTRRGNDRNVDKDVGKNNHRNHTRDKDPQTLSSRPSGTLRNAGSVGTSFRH
jgi:hypothetical protein